MNLKKIDNTFILASIAFVLCLPMIMFDNVPVSDVATRYGPMAEAFAKGKWSLAFDSLYPPLCATMAGILSWVFGFTGYVACKIISATFFALTIFPLMALMSKVFNRRYAFIACLMFICCSRLLRIAGMGVRDSAKCFFLVLAAYGLICFIRNKMNWSMAVVIGVACAGLTLTRGDSLLFALLFIAATAYSEIYKLKKIPYKTLFAFGLFLLLISPWVCYVYYETGWPVTEKRQSNILDKVFKTTRTVKILPVVYAAKSSPNPVEEKKRQQAKEKENTSLKPFLANLFNGFYPQYLIFVIPVLFFRIKRKLITKDELILFSIVLIHSVGMISQITISDGRLFIYKRYLIVATPLMFGWAAIGFLYGYDRLKALFKLQFHWLISATITILVVLSIIDGWSSVRKHRINPTCYMYAEKYLGIKLKK